jgi:ABC-type cobalamin/Fe3+-siderophores transport system ATPase subunit
MQSVKRLREYTELRRENEENNAEK